MSIYQPYRTACWILTPINGDGQSTDDIRGPTYVQNRNSATIFGIGERYIFVRGNVENTVIVGTKYKMWYKVVNIKGMETRLNTGKRYVYY